MKMDLECLRGLLQTIEDNTDSDTPWRYEKDSFESIHLAERTHDEILYHIKLCLDNNLLGETAFFEDGDIVMIERLTMDGHDFLSHITNDSIFQKISEKAASAPLAILVNIAKDIFMNHFLK